MRRNRRTLSDENDLLRHKLPAYKNLEMKTRIDEMVHKETDRQLMRYKLIDGLTLAEAAEKLDIPLSTARDHYYRQLFVLFPEITRKDKAPGV